MFRAGFAEVDITPALPCEKPGWIVKILATSVDDPIMGRVMVLEDQATRVAFVSLDVLSVRWPMAEAIRDGAEQAGIPRGNVLVAATHNHTGPPVSAPGLATKDPDYIALLVRKVADAMGRAVKALTPATMGIGSGIEGRISFIRRCIMKDGSVKTHARPQSEIRCAESAIDPEVGLVAIRHAQNQKLLGMLVNFTCHPTHNGEHPRLSAGWPGVFCNAIKEQAGADVVPVFLDGALGDTHHSNPLRPGDEDENTKEVIGKTLAGTVMKMLPRLVFSELAQLRASRQTIRIPLRDIDGPFGVNMKNRQRFAPDHVYETLIAKLRTKKAKRDYVFAEVQAIRIDDRTALVSLPAEAFSGIGLEIKRRSPWPNTYVVAPANGIVGYVPSEQAFLRGGYECTLSMGSKLDPSAAKLLTEAALAELNSLQ